MSALLPLLLFAAVLCALRARADVYAAFVSGAKEGLLTLAGMAPYLAAILAATSLLRESGALEALLGLLGPALEALGIPAEAAGALLLRPLSGSAALAQAREVIASCGADSRAARLACVVCGASETVFFTGSLYFGAAGVRRTRYAVPAALIGYLAGVAAAVCLM